MSEEKKIKFKYWIIADNRRFAVVEYQGKEWVIPFTRLVPHQYCEYKLRKQGITDPNEIAKRCAEEGSVFGFVVVRHIYHEGKTGKMFEWDKARPFPKNIDFSCVRDLVFEGVDVDEAIKRCSPPQKVKK